MELHGQFNLHHRAFIEQEKKRQRKTWEEDIVSLSGPDSLYACSSLLHLSSDYCFVLVSINGNVQQYCSDIHTPLIIVRHRVMPKKKLRKEAVQAVLQARGLHISEVSSTICKVEPGEAVFCVREHPWINRAKGFFAAPADVTEDAKLTVVPARLVRALVDPSKIKGGRVDRKNMRVLYQECRVSHLSYGKFFSLKPPEVVLGKRAGCYCGYHLRFEYQVVSPLFVFLDPPSLYLPPPLFLYFIPGHGVETVCQIVV